MKDTKKWLALLLVFLSAAGILAGGMLYINSVQNALWTKAVTDMLEVTAQGSNALDIFIEKDADALHLLATALAKTDSHEEASILRQVQQYTATGAVYFCADLSAGIVYTNQVQKGVLLSDTQKEVFQGFQGQGLREPFLDGYTGVWTVGMYERFFFADGAEGYVQRTQPAADLADRFSLSFYENRGFSYVVNQKGDILLRSQHRNSNRTFQNLFDIIDLQDNSTQEVDSFRGALENRKKGVARFQYQKEDYVFCYVPLENEADWYVVSIIPNRVIMEQANKIIQHSWILVLFVLICALLLAAFFLVYRDSTRRVLRAEENARRAAESANVAKSRFLSNMSHDIRTPMNAIIGMTKLAADHAEEPEKVKGYLKKIGLSGQLLVGLINDILDMSKIESGKMTLHNDRASLVDLVADMVNIVQPTVFQKQQKFNIRLHGVIHEFLCFDALRLQQVVLNLLSNALKFTPEGGEISVDVTEIRSLREGYAHFTIRVEDTGIGMKPEFLQDLFTSFVREQDSRVNQIEGSGLGMAITKMIVDLMEGTISVESEPGIGTAFTVDLELILAPNQPEEALPLPSLRVLVADGDPVTGQTAEETLCGLGMEAAAAATETDMLKRVLEAHKRGEGYDLVLVDWGISDTEPAQIVQMIRDHTGQAAPVIVFSSYDRERMEGLAAGSQAVGFVQKPFFRSTLCQCIRQYVLGEENLPEKPPESQELIGKRILLAEDNPLNQEIAKELLEGFGAQVETADNGLACVERFEQAQPGQFDLILLDIHMPVMDGYEAARRIRGMKRQDAGQIPIFAMTADAFAEDIEAAKKAGMDSHLAKPLDIPAMLREIHRYMNK